MDEEIEAQRSLGASPWSCRWATEELRLKCKQSCYKAHIISHLNSILNNVMTKVLMV